MPLHNWTDTKKWPMFHAYWLVRLSDDLKEILPPGYRTQIGTMPALTIGREEKWPDLGISHDRTRVPQFPIESGVATADAVAPDIITELDRTDVPDQSLLIEYEGMLIAAVELVSRRNKDREASRRGYGLKYASYFAQLVNLLLVDITPRPLGFSFAQFLAGELAIGTTEQTPAAPIVSSYRVDGRDAGRPLTVSAWLRPVAVGEKLPTIPLALNPDETVLIDLESSYARTARDCYLT